LNPGARALKGVQRVADQFAIHVGCLFQKQANFESGIQALRRDGLADLAEYLADVRGIWTATFNNRRTALEHDGWSPPHSQYVQTPAGAKYIEPEVDGIRVSDYAQKAFSRIAFFVENIVWYCYQRTLNTQGITVVEIAGPERDPLFPRRFGLGIGKSGDERWIIKHSDGDGFN
jgi:hypothetical protein